MTFFDSLLGQVREAATEVFGDDTDGVFETAGGFLSGGRGESDGGGGGGGDWTDALTSFLGGGSDDESDGGGGGGGDWTDALTSFVGGGSDDEAGGSDGGGGGWDFLGRMVDRLSGDGGRDNLLGGAVDRVSSYLPDEVRSAAGSLFGGNPSSWAGRLVDPSSTSLPDGWRPPANAAIGHSFGEGGFDGIRPRSLFPPDDPPWTEPDGLTAEGKDDFRLANLREMAAQPAPDPRVTTHADDLGQDHYDDHVDYDDLVTNGASAPGHEAPGSRYDSAPDDPTFPDDVHPAPGLVDQPDAAPPPISDFEQAIDDADQIEASMDAVSEVLE